MGTDRFLEHFFICRTSTDHNQSTGTIKTNKHCKFSDFSDHFEHCRVSIRQTISPPFPLLYLKLTTYRYERPRRAFVAWHVGANRKFECPPNRLRRNNPVRQHQYPSTGSTGLSNSSPCTKLRMLRRKQKCPLALSVKLNKNCTFMALS